MTAVLGSLLSPLRLPERVVAEIETIAVALRSLSRIAESRLTSIDDHTGALVESLGDMSATLTRLEGSVVALNGLEQTIEDRMDALREDVSALRRIVESRMTGIQAPLDGVADHVAKIEQLLPEPGDGPLTRLKDTLTKS